MTQEEILQYNKMCAEFLGVKGMTIICSDNGHHYPSIDEMKFDSDWNWIHEVVEAIERLKYGVETIGNYCHIIGTEIYSTKKTKKEAVVEAINQFLIWYNKNK